MSRRAALSTAAAAAAASARTGRSPRRRRTAARRSARSSRGEPFGELRAPRRVGGRARRAVAPQRCAPRSGRPGGSAPGRGRTPGPGCSGATRAAAAIGEQRRRASACPSACSTSALPSASHASASRGFSLDRAAQHARGVGVLAAARRSASAMISTLLRGRGSLAPSCAWRASTSASPSSLAPRRGGLAARRAWPGLALQRIAGEAEQQRRAERRPARARQRAARSAAAAKAASASAIGEHPAHRAPPPKRRRSSSAASASSSSGTGEQRPGRRGSRAARS